MILQPCATKSAGTNSAGETFFKKCGSAGPLLAAIFPSRVVGIAVVDKCMRFQTVNRTLAAMNGVPVEKHFGRKLKQILGPATVKVESAIEKVFETRESVPYMELSAKLPSRLEAGQWVASYFPACAGDGEVSQVVALVLEVTEHPTFRPSIDRLSLSLLKMRSSLHLDEHRGAISNWSGETRDLFTRALELVDHCLDELQSFTMGPVKVVKSPNEDPILRSLSLREQQVIRMIADSKHSREIADELGISVRTAEAHRAHVMTKLGFHSVAELVRFAVRHHIVDA